MTLNEKTPISLGLHLTIITTCLALIGGGAGGLWWWASWSSRIDTKLSSIEGMLGNMTTADAANQDRIEVLDRRITRIETVGSPALQSIAKDVTELLRQFEMHRLREKP